MVAKTIRFYDNRKSDREALRVLENYKRYGFRNENHMMLELLLAYGSDKDDLAEQIANKVVEKLGRGSFEKPPREEPETDDAFLRACAFMDSL